MLIQRLRLQNLLSFKEVDLELRPLNVLIGANASGKSNLLRALALVRALPKDFAAAISEGGGPRGWINQRIKGEASIEVAWRQPPAKYSLHFRETNQAPEITQEVLDETVVRSGQYITGNDLGRILLNRSVLAELRSPESSEIRQLVDATDGIRLYREFHTGPGAQARLGMASSGWNANLSEDGGNLALVLNEMDVEGHLDRVNQNLHRFFEPFDEVKIRNQGGISQVYVKEQGIQMPFAATTLSDGTLRLLCLLAVLLHPEPGPLVCIEEPEAGMHPDAIRMIAELLKEASERTQLIVTTHSPALIDALTDQPESVVVCERNVDGFTEFRRLQKEPLEEWLAEYSLGELWQKGEIGGNRW